MKERKIIIGILGAGSIGSLFGGYLANYHSNDLQIEVIFFGRNPHIGIINKEGLRIYENNTSELKINTIKAYTDYEEYKNSKSSESIKFDYVFLATKTYSTKVVLEQYISIIKSCKWFIILQNGIGNEELILKYVESRKIIRIITSHGAILKEPGKLYHTGTGFIFIGYVFQEDVERTGINLIKVILDKVGLKCEISSNILKHTWEKALVNIGINAVAALTRLKNGDLIKDKNLKLLMRLAVEEGLEVAKQKGILNDGTNYVKLMFSVAENTGENKNSMLQDILKGKPTEIDFINGKIVEYSKRLNIKTPVNNLLTILVKGLEKSLF